MKYRIEPISGSRENPQQPQQLRTDPEIRGEPIQADDCIAPQDQNRNDEHGEENPLGAAECKHGEGRCSHARRAYRMMTGGRHASSRWNARAGDASRERKSS